MSRRLFNVLSAVGMLFALALTATAFATTSPCIKNFDTTCCDYLIKTGYLIPGTGVDCSKEYNDNKICNWTPTSNPNITKAQPAGSGVSGHLGINPDLPGARCEFYQWFCKDKSCSHMTEVPVGGDCSQSAEDPNSGSCSG